MSQTTKLKAVNRILNGVGLAPVSTLSSGFSTATNAEAFLDDALVQILEQGWFFNTEREFPLLPDKDGEIYLPEGVLRVDVNKAGAMYVLRGRRLYDLRNHTFNIGKRLELDIVLSLEFDECPEAARRAAMYLARRLFQADYLGDPTLLNVQSQDEQDALLRLRRMESETSNYNIFDNPEMQLMQNRSI